MKTWKLGVLCAAISSVSTMANAVEPVGVALENGITFLPSVKVGVESNDNIYLESTGETSSTITRIAPDLMLKGDMGKFKWGANAGLEQGLYSANSNDDYLDSNLGANAEYEINARNQINAKFKLNMGHDNRGTAFNEGPTATGTPDPDQYDELTLGGSYKYGSDSAFANITGYVENYDKEYTNNKTGLVSGASKPTNIAQRNHGKLKVGALAALNVSSATKLLFELRQTTVDYTENTAFGNARDGAILKVLAGASWDITGKTTGELKLGSASRSFDQAGADTKTRLSWEGNVSFKPVKHSELKLNVAQNSNESTAAGAGFIDNTYTSLSYDHTFSTYVKAGVEYSLNSDDYIGDNSVGGKSREDDTSTLGLNVTYSPKKWVDVKASWKQASRDSNNDTLDYDNQVINLGVTLAL